MGNLSVIAEIPLLRTRSIDLPVMALAGLVLASVISLFAAVRSIRVVRGHFPRVQRLIAIGQCVWLTAGSWGLIEVASSDPRRPE
jgi:hypothetical protein